MQHYGLEALNDLNNLRHKKVGDPEIASRIAAYELAFQDANRRAGVDGPFRRVRQTLEAYGLERDD